MLSNLELSYTDTMIFYNQNVPVFRRRQIHSRWESAKIEKKNTEEEMTGRNGDIEEEEIERIETEEGKENPPPYSTGKPGGKNLKDKTENDEKLGLVTTKMKDERKFNLRNSLNSKATPVKNRKKKLEGKGARKGTILDPILKFNTGGDGKGSLDSSENNEMESSGMR